MTDRPHPIWKRDFPYEAAGEEEVTRREFARYLVLGAGRDGRGQRRPRGRGRSCARSTPASRGRSSRSTACRSASTYLFRYPADDDPAILLRVADREVVAFSQKCTHLGCVVYFQADEDRWHCPCHEGNFDTLTGAVISGPPTRPLGRIDVEIRDDGQIWALGAAE